MSDKYMYSLNRGLEKTTDWRDEIVNDFLVDNEENTFDKENQTVPERGRKLCEDALKTINGKRQDQYGNPEDSFDLIAKYWTAYLDCKFADAFGIDKNSMESVDLDGRDVAHLMALLKIARMQGQQRKQDNYVDAIGYIALAGEM